MEERKNILEYTLFVPLKDGFLAKPARNDFPFQVFASSSLKKRKKMKKLIYSKFDKLRKIQISSYSSSSSSFDLAEGACLASRIRGSDTYARHNRFGLEQ